ncbi:MAG: YdbL family protein [Phycisphaerae bacterium]|nr:YdbL family protein [Phycisphaerae bacterium]
MKRVLALLLLSFVGIGFCLSASGQGSEELKARFRDRLPALNELKDKAIIGENSRGYVEFVAKKRRGEDIVKAENADRKELYAAIAASTGTTSDLVGQRRAIQIASEARSGHMLQNDKGEWYRKP